MHWADIQAALYKRGSSIKQIALEEGVDASFVTRVIRGEKTSHGVAYAIAAKTGITTERLWPGRYKESPAELRKARKVAA